MSPIDCKIVQKNLTAYMKDGLEKPTHRVFAYHIANCDECAKALSEARLLEDALYTDATIHRPHLSTAASLRIQQNVYEQMRRSLWWQRTRSFVQAGVTIGVLIFLFGFVLPNFWLSVPNEPTTSVVADLSETSGDVVEEETAVPSISLEALLNEPSTSPSLAFFESLDSPTPGLSPEAVSRLVVDTALQGDEATLRDYFVAMPSWREPTVKIWRHFVRRCQNTLQADDLSYERVSTEHMVVGIDLIYEGNVVGEIKLRQFNGEWFTVFTRPPAINQCLIEQRITQ